MIFWHNSCFSAKNLAFKMALISESRAQRGQIEKIRPLLLLKLFEVQERKWPYFFNFRALSLRNGNKGQNQGHSPRAFMYGLLIIFFLAGERDFGMIYLPTKFHTFLWPLSARKRWWTGWRKNGRPIFLAFFALPASISHRKGQFY